MVEKVVPEYVDWYALLADNRVKITGFAVNIADHQPL